MSSREQERALRQKHARETVKLYPNLEHLRPDAPQDGYLCLSDRYTHLSLKKGKNPKEFPNLKTEVRVYDGDSFDVAIELANTKAQNDPKPVCVMNLANAFGAGGGWLRGSMAQEEALCYRSTLYATLHRNFYPLSPLEAVYSPTVVIFRENWPNKHKMMDLSKPKELPVMAVVTVAAENGPALNRSTKPWTYAKEEDRELMKDKIRVTLRVSAHNGHYSLVLGALGCGVFGNPNEVVADCFAEVLQEQEFRGWFSNVVFGVLQDKRPGVTDNYAVFRDRLDGLEC